MTLPSYQINVYEPWNGALLRIFEPQIFYDFSYERKLNDIGKVAFVLPYEVDIEALFPTDALIDVLRESPVSGALEIDDSYLVRLMHRFREDNQEQFAVGGLSLNHLLSRRIIDPADDPNAAGGYSTKAGAGDTVMRAYAQEQGGDLSRAERRFPNYTLADVPGTGNPVGARKRHENLLDTLQELAAASKVDFTIRHISGAQLRLDIGVIGTNKTRSAHYPFSDWVGFAPERGNLTSPSLTLDRKNEGNVVYVLGEGNQQNRQLFVLSAASVGDSPFNQVEFTQDARTTDKKNPLELLTQAYAALNQRKANWEFAFEPLRDAAGSTYQLDWVLGDYVTASWANVQKDVRITGVTVTLSDEGEAVEVHLEEILP